MGAMGAENGIPRMANDGGAKAYVHSLGEALLAAAGEGATMAGPRGPGR